jgi:hypothetical protein
VYVGGWPTSYPAQSVMEVSHTFDGNSAPAKKTTINRWEELVNEEVQVQQSTSTSYFLQSTVLGGKAVAELGNTGAKQVGYIFAGGMLVATQSIYLGGSSVGWISTSPATGSEYMTDMFLARKELDPLGVDVTYAPTPGLISEPIFYNPKFDQMPLQIEGGPSEEYQRANEAWANEMLAAFYLPQAEELWQTGKASAAMRLLANNPNLGVNYRVFVKNEFTRHGSYFGQDAADFLYGIDLAVGVGLLSPLVGDYDSPPKVKNATQAQQDRFNAGYNEFRNRLNANKGKNPCADLFGGIKKAEKTLKGTNFSFGPTQRGQAELLGKTVTIDPNRMFMGTSGTETIQVGFNLREKRGSYIDLDNVQAAAFILAHEVGHRAGKLPPDGNDPFGFLSVINNGTLQKACFSDLIPWIGPVSLEGR